MKTVAIVQARMGSTRVPGKVMRMLGSKPVLRWAYDAALIAPGIDEVILATSALEADDVVAQYCLEQNMKVFRGSESDVLDRFYTCAMSRALRSEDVVLRFTADCPFLDPAVIGEVVKLREMTNADYASNCYPPTYPDGLDTECFTFAALEAAWLEATEKLDRDCLTQFIVRNRSRFKVVNLTCPLPGLVKERWVLDTEKDWEFCNKIWPVAGLSNNSYVRILRCLDEFPDIRAINYGGIRNERFYEALSTEPLPPRTFERSGRVFERASKAIPLAAQTFSKSYLQYPLGVSPLAVSHGDGGYIFDVDGNRYVDLVGALGPVILGYSDPDVDEAIRRQLDNGITHSLATELEVELAELLIKHIPCAEMVKFGKSGTDVTSAAVRVARAFTGRSHVLMAGYHGWADWSMAVTDKHLGIPAWMRSFTHVIEHGNSAQLLERLDSLPNQIAAIIVEPNSDPGYLTLLRERCDHHGIVLIFDEVITGFRCDIGGAQKLYSVTPHLACFGKAMGNGMPISALVGHHNIMKHFEDQRLHYSGTFFGETLSIAAALATIKKLQREHVLIQIMGSEALLEFEFKHWVEKYRLENCIGFTGGAGHTKFSFKGEYGKQIHTLFMQEMIQNGVLIINSNMLSFAHKKPEIDRVITAYETTFEAIHQSIDSGHIKEVQPIAAIPLRAA